jgi:hypothetical protein
MTAWITITNTDIMSGRYSRWITSVQTKAAAAGEPDPTPTMIADTVAEIRGMIGFRSPQLIDANTASIAPNLKELAIEKICRRCKLWLNVALSPSEESDERTYQKRLEDLRDGKWPVDLPDSPVAPTAQVGTGVQLVSRAHRRFTPRRERGL